MVGRSRGAHGGLGPGRPGILPEAAAARGPSAGEGPPGSPLSSRETRPWGSGPALQAGHGTASEPSWRCNVGVRSCGQVSPSRPTVPLHREDPHASAQRGQDACPLSPPGCRAGPVAELTKIRKRKANFILSVQEPVKIRNSPRGPKEAAFYTFQTRKQEVCEELAKQRGLGLRQQVCEEVMEPLTKPFLW